MKLFSILVIALGVWGVVSVWRNFEAINQEFVKQAEEQIQQAIGLPVKIGGISGLFWRNIGAKDIRVYGATGSHTVIAYIPLIRSEYSAWDVLRLGKKPVRIEVERLRVTLRRDAKGKLNLELAKREAEQGELQELPKIQVHVKNAELDWVDEFSATSSQKVPFKRRITIPDAEFTLSKNVLTYVVHGRDGQAQIAATGRHSLASGEGRLDLSAHDLSIADWAAYAASSDDYAISAGMLDLGANVAYIAPNTEGIHVEGKLVLREATFFHKDLAVPIEHINAGVTFDRRNVRLDRLAASVVGNAITGKGDVNITDPLKPMLDLRIEAPKVDLATLTEILPDLVSFGPSGFGGGSAHVTGSSLDPVIDVDVKIEKAVALKETIGPATAKVHFHHMRVDVPSLEVGLGGGVATGSLWAMLDDTPEMDAALTFDNVAIGPVAAPYLEKPLPLQGRASGQVTVSGPFEAIRVAGSAHIREGAFGRQSVPSADLRFLIYKGNTALPLIAFNLAEGGSITGEGGWDDGGDLTMHLDGKDLDLVLLKRGGLDVDVSGQANVTLDMAGNMMRPDTLEIDVAIDAKDGVAYGQPIDDVTGTIRIADGKVVVRDVVGHTAGALVMGEGTVAPITFERELPPPNTKFEFTIDDADLARIPPLTSAVEASLGGLTGHASIRHGRIAVVHGLFALSGDLDVNKLDAPRMGGLDIATGSFNLVGNKLTLAAIELRRGNSTLGINGSIALTKDPGLDLRLTTQGADIRALLGAVHWRRLLEGTWIGPRLRDPKAKGPSTLYAELPDREGVRVDNRLPMDLSPIYNHWLAAHREPLNGGADLILTRNPFWESINGSLDSEIRFEGTAKHPAIWLRADVTGGKAYGHAFKTASAAASFREGELVVAHAALEAEEGGTLNAKGALGGGRELTATADGIDLAWLNPWLTPQELLLGGRMGGQIIASGDPASPRLAIITHAEKGVLNEFEYDQFFAEAVLAGNTLAIKQAAIIKEGNRATVSGDFPVGVRPDVGDLNLTLDVEGDSLGIVSVLTKGLIAWKGGDGSFKAKVLGKLADPRLSGVVELRGAAIGIETLSEPITDINARILLGTGIAQIKSLTARYGGGTIGAEGYLTLKQLKFATYNLQVVAKKVGVAMKNRVYVGQADAVVNVDGKFERPRISGDVTVSNGVLSLAPESATTSAPTGNETVVGLSDLRLQVMNTVRVFQQNLMDVRIAGNMIVNGTLTSIEPKGVVTILPGGSITTFYTNNFTVTEGSVEFLGSGRAREEVDPLVEILKESGATSVGDASTVPNARVYVLASGTTTDLEGLHRTGAEQTTKGKTVKVVAEISGSLTDLRYSFRSDPPEYTPQEVEALLGKPSLVLGVFSAVSNVAGGASFQNSGTAGIVREVAPGLVNFLVSPLVKQLLDPVIGAFVSDLSLDLVQSGIVGDVAQGGALTGLNVALSAESQPVGPLTLSYRHTFKNSGVSDLDRMGLNYRLTQNLSLAGIVETNDLGSAPGGDITVPFMPGFTLSPVAPIKAGPTDRYIGSLQLQYRSRF